MLVGLSSHLILLFGGKAFKSKEMLKIENPPPVPFWRGLNKIGIFLYLTFNISFILMVTVIIFMLVDELLL